MTTETLTGHAAIDYAEAHGLKLSKHVAPTEGARERELDRLEDELDAVRDSDDPEDVAERAAIIREMRQVEREAADEERWADEGRERGWI